MSDSLNETIANDFAALPALVRGINSFLNAHAMPHEAIFRVNLAIEEIVTNIIKYGYDDASPHLIQVLLKILPDTIHLRLQDDGHPFDPLQAPEPDIHAALDKRPIGGLGLFLVREMAARTAYRREKNTNILEVDIVRK